MAMELSAGLVSLAAELVEAVLLMVPPAAGAVTVRVTSGDVAPLSKVARLQVTVPESSEHIQPLPAAL